MQPNRSHAQDMQDCQDQMDSAHADSAACQSDAENFQAKTGEGSGTGDVTHGSSHAGNGY